MKKLFYIFVLVFFLGATGKAFSTDVSVPMYLNFHSQLTDDGGNFLPDGAAWATFRIVDEAGVVLFEERQELQVVSGNVSAFVGGGVDANNALTGGIPAEALYPHGAKYLEVIPDGAPPLEKMEIVSSPYSIYSQTALGVVPRGVTGEMIADGAIKKEHLDAELTAAIFPQGVPREMLPSDTLFQDDLTNFKNNVQGVSGAATVGVDSKFVFSGSATVQGVLSDLDTAIKKRQEEVFLTHKAIEAAKVELNGAISVEAGNRASSEAQLSTAIGGKVSKTGDEMSGDYIFKNEQGEVVAKIYSGVTSPQSLLFGHDPMGNPNIKSGFLSLYSDEQETLRLDGQMGLAKSAIVESDYVFAKKVESENLPTAVAWATISIDNALGPCSLTAGRNILSNVECQRVNDYKLVTFHLDKTKLQSITAPYLVQASGDGSFYCQSMTDDSFVIHAPLIASSLNVLVMK